ncbi:MAG: cytochrome c [Candidatus Abyssobacteria bacterium SURF_5]|uniref:Cytochrome c n=1 Tax=Abyssobacteria bacterium (strain SURF_5) TaxID=2093360 RepID=A0A3A4NM67_ABYX5|nr:MAG: cytochrome c [Candidatus Abyssubacteria bacterium SURF_5]
MNFPAVLFPVLGDRMVIAIIGIVHVLVSHGMAVGGSLFIVLLEYKSIREKNQMLNEAAYHMARWFFILTTAVGALTGVGIWFSTQIFSPVGIGSLLRLFFWVWFIEWGVFVAELSLVSIYYLTWRVMKPEKHLRVGVAYILVSLMTLFAIVGILGFQMTPGKWLETRSFWPAFFNVTYLPQSFSRMALAAMLACAFNLLIFSFMRHRFRDIRGEFLRFCGRYLLFVTPVYLFATFAYYQVLPERASQFMPVALMTLRLTQYASFSQIFFLFVAGFLFLTGLILFATRRSYGVLSVAPFILLTIGTAQFERVREFSRKPYVIEEYMYSNGIRKREAPYLSSTGVLKYYTWAQKQAGPRGAPASKGHAVFIIECSVCHTYRGMNGIFNKGPIIGTKEAAIQFLDNMQFTYPYMPPFIGTQDEKEALAEFLAEGIGGG